MLALLCRGLGKLFTIVLGNSLDIQNLKQTIGPVLSVVVYSVPTAPPTGNVCAHDNAAVCLYTIPQEKTDHSAAHAAEIGLSSVFGPRK